MRLDIDAVSVALGGRDVVEEWIDRCMVAA